MDRTLSLKARVSICAVLLLIGAGSLFLIFTTEPEAERETAVRQSAMLVQVTRPERGTFRPVIEAMGTVTAAREISLTPRVDGEVVGRAGAFVPGGFLRRGEIVVQIDDTDYRNVLLQRESELNQAIAELEIEQGRQELAERDYRELQRQVSEDNKALILRQPQLRAAEAATQAAQAAAEQARLDLERTTVRAPFDAQVLTREADIGSLVTAGDPLGRLVGVDVYWIEITLPLDKLRWLSFAKDETDRGSPVQVRHRTAWQPGQFREGHLYHLIGEIEGATRLARALVAVKDPLALGGDTQGSPSLMIGTFVECHIEGLPLEDTLRLRREYVRANDTLWLMREGALAIQPVEIVFQDAEYAYISTGLDDNDFVITSSLSTVREGVPLRVEESSAR